MANTQAITFSCESAHVSPNGARSVEVEVSNPSISDILSEIIDDDLINWMQKNKRPEDIFSQTELEKWAESEGYVKGGDNE